jgi:hypothetical protein
MNKKQFLIIFFLGSLIFSEIGLACIRIPSIEFKNENCNVEFKFEEYKNENVVLNILNEKKLSCNLNTDDIFILRDYVISGYSVKEQTDEEYNLFLKEANNANSGRPDDCLAYQAIYQRDRWTGYIETGYHYDAINGCAVPLCGGSPSVNIKWNDLSTSQSPYFYIYLIILLFVIIIAFIYKLRK